MFLNGLMAGTAMGGAGGVHASAASPSTPGSRAHQEHTPSCNLTKPARSPARTAACPYLTTRVAISHVALPLPALPGRLGAVPREP